MASLVFSMTQCSHTMTNEHDGKGQVLSSREEIGFLFLI